MTHKQEAWGHVSAGATIIFWGTTFIATKVLLQGFTPLEILLIRFVIGLAVLTAAYPKRLRFHGWKQEGLFALAGLFGICLYYLFENIALMYTMTANVGVIISTAPFFTAAAAFVIYRQKTGRYFFAGFLVAMAGIALISFHGGLHIELFGDFLALVAAAIWALYSVTVTKIGTFGYHTIQTTRRIFFYGLLFMLPLFAASHETLHWARIGQPLYLFNYLFLGVGASAICFVTWNFSVKCLGPVKTSVYIYLTPVVTVITAHLLLHEVVTVAMAVGILLTLCGLLLSEHKGRLLVKAAKKKELS